MTKSEILSQYESHRIQMGYDLDDKADMWDRGSVEGAMEDWGKIRAIEFEEWKRKTWWWTGTGWILHNKPERLQTEITDEELYNLFLTEAKSK